MKLEKEWVPAIPGFSLYMRPIGFSMDNSHILKPPNRVRLSVMGSPVGPYFPGGFQPLKFFTDEENERGGPLSAASYKLATNYGPTISSSSKGEKRGYNQVLWMGSNEDIHETGASNVFFVFKGNNGVLEVVTPPLDGSVLPGVTRDSVLHLLRGREDIEVSERTIKKNELLDSIASGKVKKPSN